MKKENYQKTIAVDFDGVIHAYSKGWHDGTIYDEPIEGAIESIERLLKRGYKVAIFTCRAETIEGAEAVANWIDNHLTFKKPEYTIHVTNIKPKAIAYIDDRGIRFTNWKDVMNYF